MAADRLINIENEIKRMIEKDKTDPKIFDKIQELVYKFFLRNKIFYDYDSAKEVSYDIAEYLYMSKVLKETDTPITAWIGYINRVYPTYVRNYLQRTQSQIIDTSKDRDLETAVIRMISGSTMDDDSISQIYAKDYLNSLPRIVEEVMRYSHFYEYTEEYINARVSLLLSIAADRYIPYRLNEVDAAYTRVLYRALCYRLAYELKSEDQESLAPVHFFLLECNNDTTYDEGGYDKWTY